jgi:hypothetical protein
MTHRHDLLRLRDITWNPMGLVRASYEIFKNEGERVLCCEHLPTAKDRHPENFHDQVQKM